MGIDICQLPKFIDRSIVQPGVFSFERSSAEVFAIELGAELLGIC